MSEPTKDATLDEKIETVNANLKPLYKQRYDNSLLMEALDVMISLLSDEDSDKPSKEFQTKRKTEVEKELARTQQLIKFFEAKLKPLQEEQKSAQVKVPPVDKPTVTEPAPTHENGKREPIKENSNE